MKQQINKKSNLKKNLSTLITLKIIPSIFPSNFFLNLITLYETYQIAVPNFDKISRNSGFYKKKNYQTLKIKFDMWIFIIIWELSFRKFRNLMG